jgi:hypothetical protein
MTVCCGSLANTGYSKFCPFCCDLSWMPAQVSCYREPPPSLPPLLANTRHHRVKHRLGSWRDGFVLLEIGIRKRLQPTTWFSKFLLETKPCLLGILSKRNLKRIKSYLALLTKHVFGSSRCLLRCRTKSSRWSPLESLTSHKSLLALSKQDGHTTLEF